MSERAADSELPSVPSPIDGINIRDPSVAEVEQYLRVLAPQLYGAEEDSGEAGKTDEEIRALAATRIAQSNVNLFLGTPPEEMALLTTAPIERLRKMSAIEYVKLESAVREHHTFFFARMDRIQELWLAVQEQAISAAQSVSSPVTDIQTHGATH